MTVQEFTKKILMITAFAIFLGACATTQQDGDTDLAPEPVEEEDAITEPGAVETPDVEQEPVDTGPAPGTQEDLDEEAGDRVFFAFDSSELTFAARQTLQAQASWLRQFPNVNITIEGHADERGTREYNLALGDRRATAAKNYLVALGISEGRISTISYGKERPAVLGSNEAAWAQNRRAVTVVE